MGFVFERGESVADGVRRIVCDELDAAISDLQSNGKKDRAEAIHDARKHCKKIRALIRLARPGLRGHFGSTNAAVRDAARQLSQTRDAQALADTFTRMLEHGEAPAGDRFASVSDALDQASHTVTTGADTANLAAAAALLTEVRRNVKRWPLDELGTNRRGFDGIRPGLTDTYDRARRAMSRSRHRSDPAMFHEWRKHAKYGWYHLRLLENSAPSVLAPLAEIFSELADTLGDAHDLAVLATKLATGPDQFGDPSEVGRAIELIEHNRAELERRALGVGARLYAEPPTIFVDRLEAYWRLWQRQGDEHVIGTVDSVLDDIAKSSKRS